MGDALSRLRGRLEGRDTQHDTATEVVALAMIPGRLKKGMVDVGAHMRDGAAVRAYERNDLLRQMREQQAAIRARAQGAPQAPRRPAAPARRPAAPATPARRAQGAPFQVEDWVSDRSRGGGGIGSDLPDHIKELLWGKQDKPARPSGLAPRDAEGLTPAQREWQQNFGKEKPLSFPNKGMREPPTFEERREEDRKWEMPDWQSIPKRRPGEGFTGGMRSPGDDYAGMTDSQVREIAEGTGQMGELTNKYARDRAAEELLRRQGMKQRPEPVPEWKPKVVDSPIGQSHGEELAPRGTEGMGPQEREEVYREVEDLYDKFYDGWAGESPSTRYHHRTGKKFKNAYAHMTDADLEADIKASKGTVNEYIGDHAQRELDWRKRKRQQIAEDRAAGRDRTMAETLYDDDTVTAGAGEGLDSDVSPTTPDANAHWGTRQRGNTFRKTSDETLQAAVAKYGEDDDRGITAARELEWRNRKRERMAAEAEQKSQLDVLREKLGGGEGWNERGLTPEGEASFEEMRRELGPPPGGRDVEPTPAQAAQLDALREKLGISRGAQGAPRGAQGSPMPESPLNDAGDTLYDQEHWDRAGELLEKVKEREEDTTIDMVDVADGTGGEMVGLDFRMKGQASLARKLKGAITQEGAADLDEAEAQIKDALRYTISYPHDRFTQSAEEALADFESRGYTPKVKNYWRRGNPYLGTNVPMTGPDGNAVEMQFHTPESLAVKEQIHGLYEEYRTATNPRTRRELWQQMVVLQNQTPIPHGSERLPNQIIQDFEDLPPLSGNV